VSPEARWQETRDPARRRRWLILHGYASEAGSLVAGGVDEIKVPVEVAVEALRAFTPRTGFRGPRDARIDSGAHISPAMAPLSQQYRRPDDPNWYGAQGEPPHPAEAA
jgi:hypothetical protein